MTHSENAAKAIDLLRRLRGGQFDDSELDAILEGLTEVFAADDINSLHVPEDAGEYRKGIVELISRIPDGWGRWISCDAGWYPLITELGTKLAAIDPNYVVHQIKEKFGTLRFYAETDAEGERLRHFEALIASAEEKSANTCERCGRSPAELHVSKVPPLSYGRTLCRACWTA